MPGVVETGRPVTFTRQAGTLRRWYEGRAFPHFNEADEGVAVDALVTDRVWRAMGLVPDNTLHDVRWGEQYGDEFVWVYEISGSVPASHLGGWDKAEGWRQGPVFFPAGGSTVNGVSKPGAVVLSRIYIADGVLNADVFRGTVVELPPEETERRKQGTNPEWPIAHVVLHVPEPEIGLGQGAMQRLRARDRDEPFLVAAAKENRDAHERCPIFDRA